MVTPHLRKLAVALKYSSQHKEPQVVASGEGLIADRIEQIARESLVPVHRDTHLATLLRKVEVGQPIPPELYHLVAEVLALVLRLEEKAKALARRE